MNEAAARKAARTKMMNTAKTMNKTKYMRDYVAKSWQELVRLRAADEFGWVTCVTCGVRSQWNNYMQGSHYKQGRRMSSLVDPMNCHPCCNTCNKNSGSLDKFAIFMAGKYTQEELDALDRRHNSTVEYSREELVEMNLAFKKEAREIKARLKS